MLKYIIKDWADNLIELKNKSIDFDTFEDAEEALSEVLGSKYDTDRGEYYIHEVYERNSND